MHVAFEQCRDYEHISANTVNYLVDWTGARANFIGYNHIQVQWI